MFDIKKFFLNIYIIHNLISLFNYFIIKYCVEKHFLISNYMIKYLNTKYNKKNKNKQEI